MKFTAVATALVAAPLAAANGDYSDYLSRHPRTFANAEEREAREALFAARVAAIEAHNADGSQSYTKGINQFTDMFDEEIRRETLGYVPTKTTRGQAAPHRHLEATADANGDKVDWREVPGVLTAIKDQGHCGSCWTFAGTAAIESAVAINTGKLYALSEQQSVSCIANPDSCGGTGGCSGATAEMLFEWAVDHGVASEWTYPYTSHGGVDGFVDGAPKGCIFNETVTPAEVIIDGYVKLPENEEAPLLSAVAEQPIAVSVDASTWHAYEGGIYTGCSMASPEIDHAVILAGYGTEDGQDYWLIRNSWGPNWGENGFIRIARSSDEEGNCGVDTNPAMGTGCDGGPANVTVCGTCGILYDSSYPTGAEVAPGGWTPSDDLSGDDA